MKKSKFDTYVSSVKKAPVIDDGEEEDEDAKDCVKLCRKPENLLGLRRDSQHEGTWLSMQGVVGNHKKVNDMILILNISNIFAEIRDHESVEWDSTACLHEDLRPCPTPSLKIPTC